MEIHYLRCTTQSLHMITLYRSNCMTGQTRYTTSATTSGNPGAGSAGQADWPLDSCRSSLNVHTDFPRSQEPGIRNLTIGKELKSFGPLTQEIVHELLSVLVHFVVHLISAPCLSSAGWVEWRTHCYGVTRIQQRRLCRYAESMS